ncbi:MAG: hypothetical protein WDZ85_04100 [Candidatus Paceibacterota bacterium]
MINLFPDNKKRQLIRDYRERRTIVGLVLLITLCLVGIILMTSFYVTLYMQAKSLENSLAINESEPAGLKLKDLRQVADETNRRSALVLEQPAFVLSDIISKILDESGNNIVINVFSVEEKITEEDDKQTVIFMSGIASRRSVLVDYVEKLKQDPMIKSVDSPVGNLIKEVDNDFSLTVVLKNL